MTIRDATPYDLSEIATCHISAFPGSLSSALGKKYVAKMLEWYLSSPDTFLFLIEDKAGVAGYCGGMLKGTSGRMGSASGMAQYSFNEGIKSLLKKPWLLFHKEMLSKYSFVFKNILMKFWKAFLKNNVENSAPVPVSKSYAALVVIGVKREFQKMGIGSKLLVEFENKVKLLGFEIMMLTVRKDNRNAINSYERNGWLRKEVKDNSVTMYKSLN